jgi:hypothetical protein
MGGYAVQWHAALGRVGGQVRLLAASCSARAHREELDGLIADGAGPSSSRLCEARARQLVGSRYRSALASEIEALIELAGAASVGASSPPTLSLVDLQIDEVRAARSQLSKVAEALRSADPPVARGVALATLLVRDGRSPLYVENAPDDVQLAATATAAALIGSTPGSDMPRWWASNSQ